MAEIKFSNTSSARSSAEDLIAAANSYSSCISTLQYMQKQIANNWEGNSADIAAIQTELTNSINEYNNKIIPALEKLGNGITAFANATDKVAANTIEQATGVVADVVTGVATGIATGGSGSQTDKRLDALEKKNKELEAELKEANKSNWTKSNEEFGRDFVDHGKEYADRVGEKWTNVAEDFKKGNIVTGVVDTVGATLGTVWDTGGLVVAEVVECGDWLVDQVFGNDGLIGNILDWF